MKRLAKFSLSFILAVMAVALNGCKDQDSYLLTNTPAPSPGLAGDIDPGLVLVCSKHADGPMIEEWIKPVIWDGVSPLETGVLYWFPSLEVERAAMAATSPQHLKWFEERMRDLAEMQGKTKSSAVLAVDDFNAYANVTFPGSQIKGRGQCHTLSGWSPPWDFLSHQIYIDTDSHGNYSLEKTYEDGAQHYDDLQKSFNCAESIDVDAYVRTDGGTQDDAHDSDSCN